MPHNDYRAAHKKRFADFFQELGLSSDVRHDLLNRLAKWEDFQQGRFVELGAAISEFFNDRYDVANEQERAEFSLAITEMILALDTFSLIFFELAGRFVALGGNLSDLPSLTQFDFMETNKINGRMSREQSLKEHPEKFNWRLNLRSEANI